MERILSIVQLNQINFDLLELKIFAITISKTNSNINKQSHIISTSQLINMVNIVNIIKTQIQSKAKLYLYNVGFVVFDLPNSYLKKP